MAITVLSGKPASDCQVHVNHVGGAAAGDTPNTVHLAGGQVSHLSWPTGFQTVGSLADRRDALSSLTGWKHVLLPKGAKWTVLGDTPAAGSANQPASQNTGMRPWINALTGRSLSQESSGLQCH